ncbi:TetR/AcrR family transcriptional regulator [Amycolatopsis taiwanensis]|uniref:TetR/AcrR family transcriptional regulator n=1 Tax=Amycolatopsis taiwanensis TaxID=342230 RepID=UPI001B805476|nr:helix-turn-helix domain-containing protein [Amycolatopsis taiwanensis]
MTPGGGGYSRRGGLRREQIMDTAEEVFAAEGFNATSLRTLAKKVGVTHAGILRHYSSKDDLLLALLEREESSLLWGPPSAAPGIDPAAAIERTARAQLQLYRRAVHNEAHADRVALYSALVCEATAAKRNGWWRSGTACRSTPDTPPACGFRSGCCAASTT